MSLPQTSISCRITSVKKKLGLENRAEMIEYHAQYLQRVRAHKRERCQIILSWLLDPPPGQIRRPTITIKWKRTFGQARKLRHSGLYIHKFFFENLNETERQILDLKLRGLPHERIAKRLKLKLSTMEGYFAYIRHRAKWSTGVSIPTDDLLHLYKNYLKQNERNRR